MRGGPAERSNQLRLINSFMFCISEAPSDLLGDRSGFGGSFAFPNWLKLPESGEQGIGHSPAQGPGEEVRSEPVGESQIHLPACPEAQAQEQPQIIPLRSADERVGIGVLVSWIWADPNGFILTRFSITMGGPTLRRIW